MHCSSVSHNAGVEYADRFCRARHFTDLVRAASQNLRKATVDDNALELGQRLRDGVAAFDALGCDAPLHLPGIRQPVVGIQFDKVRINASSAMPVIIPLECTAATASKASTPRMPQAAVSFAVQPVGPDDDVSLVDMVARAESKDTPARSASFSQPLAAGLLLRRIMYKPEDVRKDQVILRMVRLFAHYLAEAGEQLPIQTYTATPTAVGEGLVEMVPHARTIFDIQRQNGGRISRFLLSIDEPRAVVQERFAQSYAVSTVMMFLLGTGDRHMENQMITANGTFFHIDFGFILGDDPKPPLCSRVPLMQSFMEAIGSAHRVEEVGVLLAARALNARQFNRKMGVVYNILRHHTPAIAALLGYLYEAKCVVLAAAPINIHAGLPSRPRCRAPTSSPSSRAASRGAALGCGCGVGAS